MENRKTPERIGTILQRVLDNVAVKPENATLEKVIANQAQQQDEKSCRFDFDLAEFPLFRFYRPDLTKHGRDPLEYSDTITGNDGKTIKRQWRVYPGPFGFGGSSTQELLFDLLQLYAEQGARGTQIQFGTLRSLFLRRGERNPSKKDYVRMRRDIDVLRGYDFHCTNAFWDQKRQAYVDMTWRLFGSAFYFKPHPTDEDKELPFGFLEVSTVLQEIAKTRGFFALGFGGTWFHQLRPLEQRLALYLSKKFVSQKMHRRFVRDLAKALPIEATLDADIRKILKSAANGLLGKKLPCLASFHFEKSLQGHWLAVFKRNVAPKQDYSSLQLAGAALSEELEYLVFRITEAVGSDADKVWWSQCARRLGEGAITRGLGLLKEAKQNGSVRNPGGLLTTFLKDIALEHGISIGNQ
ncbi:MAG: hypothetical protein JNJ77_00845 [Planctomycetia bacterium]|nr:hypothetical protein [Planctomycetia bacterium]